MKSKKKIKIIADLPAHSQCSIAPWIGRTFPVHAWGYVYRATAANPGYHRVRDGTVRDGTVRDGTVRDGTVRVNIEEMGGLVILQKGEYKVL